MSPPIDIVAAVIRDDAGRTLLVRKHGTAAFMQPGGKREPGEDDLTALARELDEELGLAIVAGSVRPRGSFRHRPATRPDATWWRRSMTWRWRAARFPVPKSPSSCGSIQKIRRQWWSRRSHGT